MSWHAAEAIDETVEQTRKFLTPIDTGLWARLAVVAFFIGSISLSMPVPPLPPEAFVALTEVSGVAVSTAFVAGIIGVSVIFGLGLLFVSSVFNFVLFQGLMEEKLHLGDLFSRNMGRGVQFMAFQFLAFLIGIGIIAGIVILAMLETVLLIPAVIALIPLALLSGVVMTLVHDFVLPDMIKNDRGLIESLRTVFGGLRGQGFQVAVYFVLKIAISMAVGAAVSFGSFAAIILLAILLGVPAAVLSMVGIPAGLLFLVLGIIGFVAIMLFVVAVPVNVFMYFYALNVYEKLLQ